MSKRDDRVSLGDMLDHAREAVALLGAAGREELATDRLRQLALVRPLEIVGEGARRVSPKTQQRHCSIPWAAVVGMRDRLIHGYDVVDLDIVWDTITTDLPPVIEALEAILSEVTP
ncbi:MAG: DUF86 domain-containing protein [Candidatus Schekmanbacteria bacterium]|nr:DUF86 domain-containing protein [Candidatus Schekmanbacteria bacterium]